MNVHPSIAPLLEKGLPHIGEEDITWAMTIGFLALDVIKKGFRLGAVFVLFPVYIFILMEIAGYIVLFTTGMSAPLTQARVTRNAKRTNVARRSIRPSLGKPLLGRKSSCPPNRYP